MNKEESLYVMMENDGENFSKGWVYHTHSKIEVCQCLINGGRAFEVTEDGRLIPIKEITVSS